jgi:hypothetical protein
MDAEGRGERNDPPVTTQLCQGDPVHIWYTAGKRLRGSTVCKGRSRHPYNPGAHPRGESAFGR